MWFNPGIPFRKGDQAMTDTIDVSVVVCTCNRAPMLRDALESLTHLETGGRFTYEVLVIDNASTDDTPTVIAEVAGRSAVPMRGVREPRRGIVPARNRGIDEARGEWIAFFDDDQAAETDWLAELMAAADRHQARCVGGAVHLRLPAESRERQLSPVCRMLLGETVGMTAERPYSVTVSPGAGNLLLHRDLFEEVGRFDEAFATRGEDTDLFMRIYAAGIEAWYTPTAVVQHVIPPERLSDGYLIEMAARTAEGMAFDERDARGVWLFPLIWLARIGQAACLLLPRWVGAVLCRDREQVLGARCRLAIAARYLRDGARLMTADSSPSHPGCGRRARGTERDGNGITSIRQQTQAGTTP